MMKMMGMKISGKNHGDPKKLFSGRKRILRRFGEKLKSIKKN
jgi:hypothetical protein